MIVSKGDRVEIEKEIYIDILWPNSKRAILKNELNNNSLVCKINFGSLSILDTGDIEELAEHEILKEFQDEDFLKANILKVAHHGSQTSSSEEFLEAVKPEIALIGVGKNNKFDHPNKEVIERLEQNEIQIMRTDEKGEIKLILKENKIKK